jgi:hypothetical protein
MVNRYIDSKEESAICALARSTELKNQLDGYAYESLSMSSILSAANFI